MQGLAPDQAGKLALESYNYGLRKTLKRTIAILWSVVVTLIITLMVENALGFLTPGITALTIITFGIVGTILMLVLNRASKRYKVNMPGAITFPVEGVYRKDGMDVPQGE